MWNSNELFELTKIRKTQENKYIRCENYEINMVSALLATHNLFSRLASQTAEMKGYQYPKEAENYTKILLEKAK